MQIIIQKFSRKEREAFFRKNKWLIYRLLGIKVQFPDVDADQDAAPEPYKSPQAVSELSEEEREEQLEEIKEEIEEVLEVLEEDIKEMAADGIIDEEEILFVEDLEGAIEELQEVIELDLTDIEDNLTNINGLGPKTSEGLQELGITSFQQLANLTDEEIEALDQKIKNFAKTYERKGFRQQAKDLL
ncbi:MAG: hypothetical protein AB8E82_10735 [Aureispira sp.]